MSRTRQPHPGRWALCAGVLLAIVACGTSLFAHDLRFVDVRLTLSEEGRYCADVKVDLDALTLGVSPDTPSEELVAALERLDWEQLGKAIERTRETLLRRIRIRFDGEPVQPELTFPQYEGAPVLRDGEASLLGLIARFEGSVPPDAESVTFFASRSLGMVELSVTDRRTGEARELPLQPGEESPPFSLVEPAASPGSLEVARRYLVLGFEHILPRGLDHILFVVGLFLLSTRLRPLLWQVTAFTLAHTMTLGLAIYGVVSLPARVVEPLIALSIAYVAIENLLVTEMKPWRPVVVFAFGLLHGLGFAGVLIELGLPRDRMLSALLSFNVGVELGQLAVIGIAFVLVGAVRNREWYRHRIVFPGSVCVALVGLYWTIERIAG